MENYSFIKKLVTPELTTITPKLTSHCYKTKKDAVKHLLGGIGFRSNLIFGYLFNYNFKIII